ncbi:MAG: hypothetical protein AAF402_01230 [Pseudomonadota bacterium]
MTKFIFVYHGGSMPETEEEAALMMAKWHSWFDGLGSAVIDGGNPVGLSKTVNSNGSVDDHGGANPASGYSLLQADTIEAALDMAQGCPIRESGGSIEVAPIVEMD